MFILTFFERIPITLATTILANIDNSISISNWPDYKFSFPEFLINHLLPIVITTFLTLFITLFYDKSRNRELKKIQFLEGVEKYVEEYISINETLLSLYFDEQNINIYKNYFLLASRIRENHNRVILHITRFNSTLDRISSTKFIKNRKNSEILKTKLDDFKSNILLAKDSLLNALELLNQEEKSYDKDTFLELLSESVIYDLNHQLVEITALLL
ncbi:hypothetical protein [Erysipelothrix sp. P66]|uniref:hypothetical protein n=1 Tax=Erysipelothrix sp. P66 TaxID=3141531 RepID=UPI00315DCD82